MNCRVRHIVPHWASNILRTTVQYVNHSESDLHYSTFQCAADNQSTVILSVIVAGDASEMCPGQDVEVVVDAAGAAIPPLPPLSLCCLPALQYITLHDGTVVVMHGQQQATYHQHHLRLYAAM